MNFQAPGPSIKAVTTSDLYDIIDKCKSKTLRITYCSLTLNKQCVNTKTITMRVNKINRPCEMVEGVILINREPVEDIILKNSQILNVQCMGEGQTPDKSYIFDIIRNCRGFVRITQCTNLEGGQCKNTTNFPFLVTDIDERNNNIKGYRIRNSSIPEYTLIDVSLITRVECLTQNSAPNLPWNLISYLKSTINK